MRIAFVHPDLGIGGAERLIVDAATSMASRGHSVNIYTSHHSDSHTFIKKSNPHAVQIRVCGDWLPTNLAGRFRIAFATLRAIWLALMLVLGRIFGLVAPFDIVFIDQISFTVPLLKLCGQKTLFYCHFPDKLLAPPPSSNWPILIQRCYLLYRNLFDWFEEWTMLQADGIVVNSKFTAKAFMGAFPRASKPSSVIYPGVDASQFALTPKASSCWITILSINRFERKKALKSAIDVMAGLREAGLKNFPKVRLVLAGGYDERLDENREHLIELYNYARDQLGFTAAIHFAYDGEDQTSQILFLPSVSLMMRNNLMTEALCLIYTPPNEHFGIVPVEAMAAGLPVIACRSGGPCETIIDGQTGFLCDDSNQFTKAIAKLLTGSANREKMSACARKRAQCFSLTGFSDSLEKYLYELLQK